MKPVTKRRGFTLLELMVVVMIVGILAGLAIPNLRGAVLRADAARVLGDARAVGLAAHEFLSDHGRFPMTGTPGEVPEELETSLAGVEFEYKGMTYTWYGVPLAGVGLGTTSRNVGIFAVEYNDRQDIGNALSGFTGPDVYWSETMFYVLFWD